MVSTERASTGTLYGGFAGQARAHGLLRTCARILDSRCSGSSRRGKFDLMHTPMQRATLTRCRCRIRVASLTSRASRLI